MIYDFSNATLVKRVIISQKHCFEHRKKQQNPPRLSVLSDIKFNEAKQIFNVFSS